MTRWTRLATLAVTALALSSLIACRSTTVVEPAPHHDDQHDDHYAPDHHDDHNDDHDHR